MSKPSAEAPGKRPHVSASQIQTYRLCKRKWGIGKIDGIREPGSKYTEFGTKLHKVAEDYLGEGIPPDPDDPIAKIALAGKRFWPEPKTSEVEKYFKWEDGKLTVVGYIDVYRDDPASTLVLDHKSTGDFRWIKSPTTLQTDVQAMTYAYMGLLSRPTWPNGPQVDLQWIYYLRSRPQARKVQLRVLPEEQHASATRDKGVRPEHFGCVTPEHVSDQWQRIYQDGIEMTQLRLSGEKGASLEPDFAGCSAFGGCFYREKQCKPKPIDYLRSAMTQQSIADQMSAMKDRLNKKNAKKEDAAEKPEDKPKAPSVSGQSASQRAAGMKAKLQASKDKPALSVVTGGKSDSEAPPVADSEAPPVAESAASPKSVSKKAAAAAAKKAKPAINPPEAPQGIAALTPQQVQAWETARAMLCEQIRAGVEPDATKVASVIDSIALTIKGL
jgi:hypothetical protein